MAETKEKRYVSDNAQLMVEWDREANDKMMFYPHNVTLGNNALKVHWTCAYGHKWQATVHSRFKLKTNCPYCSGRYATIETSLATMNPALSSQWDYSKNERLTPLNVKPFSHSFAWWLCEKGHSWKARISDRSNGNGCPICMTESHSSFPEQALYYYLKKIIPTALNRYKHDDKYEADIYLPEHRIAIEYDGAYFHSNNSMDARKEAFFKKNNIVLIRVKEGADTAYGDGKTIIGVKNNPTPNDLTFSFNKLFAFLLEKYHFPSFDDIDVARDTQLILSQFLHIQKSNSIAHDLKLLEEWDYDKNGNINPYVISKNSNRAFWWICRIGHSWKASCNNRSKGRGCPYCVGKKVAPGENDLATTHPHLVNFWSARNSIKPSEITAGSDKKVWWTCNRGHEYESSPSHIVSGRGCPYCASRKVLLGYNDFASCHPELLCEWDFSKNDINPTEITSGSTRKVFWRCSQCNFSWSASIGNRSKGADCPKCSRESAKTSLRLIALQEQGSLYEQHPDLMLEWDWTKNSHLDPKKISAGSSEKVWWICQKCNRNWCTQIRLRTKKGCGCQSCSNKKNKGT